MKRSLDFKSGIDHLLDHAPQELRGKRLALLSHPASIDSQGRHSSVMLRDRLGNRLVALFGPEHGFFGVAGAGDLVGDSTHPAWGVPVYSLYGDHRRPTVDMLRDIDVVIFDLQDIAVRCYTFVSTLLYVMEECARHGKRLIVCDRPIPFPNTVDGPMLDLGFESFVACVPMPLVYGMTPAESAQFLYDKFAPNLDLKVIPMLGYSRTANRENRWGPWISPSPGIRTWQTVWTYPTTVIGEALPSLTYGRGGLTPFEYMAAPWIDAERSAKKLNALKLPGVLFSPCWVPQPGVKIVVTNAERYRPVTTGIALLATLQSMYGKDKVWGHPETRPDFFDKLMGTDRVRKSLLAGTPWRKIAAQDQDARKKFMKERRAALLY